MTLVSIYCKKFLLDIELRAQSFFPYMKAATGVPPESCVLLANVFMSKALIRNNYSKNSDIGKLKDSILK